MRDAHKIEGRLCFPDFLPRKKSKQCTAVAAAPQSAHEDVLQGGQITHESKLLRDVPDE